MELDRISLEQAAGVEELEPEVWGSFSVSAKSGLGAHQSGVSGPGNPPEEGPLSSAGGPGAFLLARPLGVLALSHLRPTLPGSLLRWGVGEGGSGRHPADLENPPQHIPSPTSPLPPQRPHMGPHLQPRRDSAGGSRGPDWAGHLSPVAHAALLPTRRRPPRPRCPSESARAMGPCAAMGGGP